MPALLFCLCLLSLTAHAADTGPCWPLQMDSRYLTGNFMEPRSGRFHTGLDLKTNGETGYAVLAAEDGWISRLKYSANGYGRAVYLTTDDGATYVYGHLWRLADDLRGLVQREQDRQHAYAVDFELERDQRRVERGQVLALSGQSATTGPHLHFEVRGPDGVPRDPLAYGFAIPDTAAPEILVVRVTEAVGTSSSLAVGDGRRAMVGRLPDLQLGNQPVRFSARIVERSDHLRYRLEPARVQLFLDDEAVFSVRNDGVAWTRNRQQRLEFVLGPHGTERWLYRDERASVAGRLSRSWLDSGWLPPGRHEMRLVAEDRQGNRSQVVWNVSVAAAADTATNWRGWSDGGMVGVDPWQVDLGAAQIRRGVVRGHELEWTCAPLLSPAPRRWLRQAQLVPRGVPVQYRGRRPILIPPVVQLPDAAARFDFIDTTVAIYELENDGWSFVAPAEPQSGGAGFPLPRVGVYRALSDTTAPVWATEQLPTDISRRSASRRHGILMPRWPVLALSLREAGSGLDWPTLRVSLDDEPLWAEPDGPRDRILVEFPDDLEPGRHRLEVSIRDRVGHIAAATWAVRLHADAGEKHP